MQRTKKCNNKKLKTKSPKHLPREGAAPIRRADHDDILGIIFWIRNHVYADKNFSAEDPFDTSHLLDEIHRGVGERRRYKRYV